jgi:Zn-dependent peptidase ImmA (M78 family)
VLERKFPRLDLWEGEKALPTLKQIESFANSTRTPLGYLFLPEPPEEHLPFPHYRTIATKRPARPSPDLLETVHLMQLRQEWMREYLLEEQETSLPFVGSARLTDDVNAIAVKIRLALGLSENWAGKHETWESALIGLRVAIEGIGILVVANGVVGNNTHRPLDVGEFRGFVLNDDIAPLIFVNGADGKAAQMFTLIHEVAHVWLGSSAAFDLRQLQPANDVTELTCDKIAAEVLVPAERLRLAWAELRTSKDRFGKIARLFKVSSLVAARRARDLELIGKNEFLDFYNKYMQREITKHRSDGGDFYKTQFLRIGRRFGEAIVQATREGRLRYHEAYRLTGLNGKTFDQFAAKLLDRPAA